MEIARLEPLALVRELRLGQQPTDDVDGFLGSGQGLLDLEAVAAVHEADAAGPQPEGTEAASGQVVDAASAHRQQGRRARVEAHDGGGEVDPGGLSGQDRQQRECVLAGLLGRAEGGVAEALALLDPGDQLLPLEVAGMAHEAHRPVLSHTCPSVTVRIAKVVQGCTIPL